VRGPFPQDLSCPPLMGRIAEGVEEADAYRFDLQPLQVLPQEPHLLLIQVHQDPPVLGQPLRHLPAEAAGHQGLGPLEGEVVEDGPPLHPHIEDVPKAPGGDKGCSCPLPLDNRVGGESSGVDDALDILGPQGAAAQGPGEAVDDAYLGLVRGQHLLSDELALAIIPENHIGEGPPDIDARRVHA